MIANLGFGCLFIAFLISLYAIGTAIYGLHAKSAAFVKSARVAAMVTFPLITFAVLALLALMLTEQFQYTFVFRVISQEMPLYLKITALWGGQAGSLLFWVWLLSGMIAANFLWDKSAAMKEYAPWMVVTTMVVLGFFLFMVLFLENPFEQIWLYSNGQVVSSFIQPYGAFAVQPPDGEGLNPLLRHYGMIMHPPMLYLGFVTFSIPFAYAVSSLISGHFEHEWLNSARGWALASWIFLSTGLVLGSRWSYDVLGWGGYWGWDPVEIAALMPWLTATAFLHSAIMQERRSLFKRWNYVLILLTFCLVILGTFLTRTGVLSSVHAFAQSSIGPAFFVLIGLIFAVSLGLMLWRWNLLGGGGEMRSLASRESIFLFNNILFICIFLVCLTGVLFPILSEIVTGQQVTVGPQWYKSTTGPLFAILLLLMGIVPLSAWGASTARKLAHTLWKPALVSLVVPLALLLTGVPFGGAILVLWLGSLVVCVLVYDLGRTVAARHRSLHESVAAALAHMVGGNHQRYGGYLVHLGVVLMAVGIVGVEFFQTQTQTTLSQNGTLSFAGFNLRFDGLKNDTSEAGRTSTVASLSGTTTQGTAFTLAPRLDDYLTSQQAVTIPGLRSTLVGDLYVVLVDWQATQDSATFRVFYNPLIDWLWLGAIVLVLGGLLAFWPSKPALKRVQQE